MPTLQSVVNFPLLRVIAAVRDLRFVVNNVGVI